MDLPSVESCPRDRPLPELEAGPWLREGMAIVSPRALIMNGLAKLCAKCRRATRLRHLDGDERCPDCRA
jgi:hypothetical protein